MSVNLFCQHKIWATVPLFSLLTLVSCSKDSDKEKEAIQPRVVGHIQLTATPGSLMFMTLLPTDLLNVDQYKLESFVQDAAGDISLDIRGLNGRSALGDLSGGRSALIQTGDTVIVKENGVIKKYLTRNIAPYDSYFYIKTGMLYDDPDADGRALYETMLANMRAKKYKRI